MAKLKLRKNGIYELRVQNNGKRYYVYSKSKVEVWEKFKKLKKEIAQQKTVQKNITLAKFYPEWYSTFKKPFVTEDTGDKIKIYFDKHILPVLGNQNIKDLTSTVIQRYLNTLPKTRTKELITTYLKAILTKAHDLDLIKNNPFKNVVKEKKLNNVRPSLDMGQQKKLLNYLIKNDMQQYYITMFYILTGIRRSEILRLEFKNNIIYVNGTKREKSVRQITISDKFKNEIIDKINFKELTKAQVEYLSQKYTAIFKKLKIKATLHSLRHTFATNLYYLGYPAKQVQQWMGHASITMTLDIYTNLNNDLGAEIKTYWRDWFPEV